VLARGNPDELARDAALHQLGRGALRLAVVIEQSDNRLAHSKSPLSFLFVE
jgi:hypothetical protein